MKNPIDKLYQNRYVKMEKKNAISDSLNHTSRK